MLIQVLPSLKVVGPNTAASGFGENMVMFLLVLILPKSWKEIRQVVHFIGPMLKISWQGLIKWRKITNLQKISIAFPDPPQSYSGLMFLLRGATAGENSVKASGLHGWLSIRQCNEKSNVSILNSCFT